MRQSLTAEIIALQALAYLAAEPDALRRLLASSGMDADALRRGAEEPHLLAGVLEFLLTQEELLIRFCQCEGVEARAVHLAAARLGG